MIEMKEICTCNHCLKTCDDGQIIDKSGWFHFRRKLDDDSMDLTNSVDFCPDCAKLLAKALRKYMNNADYGHLDKTELEINNIYRELYLDIYASVLMFIIQGDANNEIILGDFIDAIPGELSFKSVHRSDDVSEYEVYINTIQVYIQRNSLTTNLRTDWKNLSIVTNEITTEYLSSFLSYTDSPVNFALFDNVYPKNSNACTVDYLLECIGRIEQSGCESTAKGSHICAKIISRIRQAINLIRDKS